MKKPEIILMVAVALLALIVISSVLFFSGKKPETKPTLPPIQIFSPPPTPIPQVIIPNELQEEKTKQENYARTREEYLQARPWLFKLPLKSDNYFVSYNASDAFVIELYYLENSNLTKEQQLDLAKQAALNTLTSQGVDINKQKIEYLELLKK